MRILLRDLAPNVAYALQLRAVAGDQISDWSRIFNVTTSTDTVPPKKPTNLVGSMSGTSFILKWDNVTQSIDNTPATDLDYYQVQVTSSGSGLSGTFIVRDIQFELTFPMNVQTFAGTPQANIAMAVRAVDKAGNSDGYTTAVSQTNPAPANVTGLTATSLPNAIGASWTPNTTDLDLQKYVAYVGTSAGFTPGAGTKVWEGLSTSFEYSNVSYAVDQWVKVVAVDVFGTPSATPASAGPVRPSNPTSVDSTAPAVPTGLAATLTNATDGKTAQAVVSWTAVPDTDNDLASYILGYKPSATTDWQYTTVDYTLTSTTLVGLLPYVNYDFRIRSSDFSANLSSWSSTVTKTATANAAPSVPTGLSVTAGKDNIIVRWTANTEPDMANGAGVYDVTIATDSGFTANVLQYRTGADNIAVNGLNTNQIYYARVRATDSGGVSSAYSTSANATTSNFSGGSDGAVPTGAPTLSASAGIGYIYLSWTPLANADPLTYDVYMSTSSGFTTYDATTKITEVSGTSAFIDTIVSGATLTYGTTYYFKVRARDKDGVSATVSNQASAAPVKAAIGDISATPRQLGVPIITTASTAPSSPISGDIWNDTTTGQEKQWTGAAWVATGNISDKYIAAQGTDLVTNGTGILGSNYNFSTFFNYNGTDAPTGANGSFVTKTTASQGAYIDEFISFDPSKSYKFSFQCRQTVSGQTTNMYGFLMPWDAFNLSIQPYHYMYLANTTTTLALPLNPGDTTITLTDASNWYGSAGKPAGANTYYRNAIFWDYTDPGGKLWPVQSYSRNFVTTNGGGPAWADGGISGNVITLSAPYAGIAHPAGTSLSNQTSGGAYIYMPSATNVVVPETWTTYSNVFSAGVLNPVLQSVAATGSAGWTTGLPPGTAKIKVGWLLNYNTGGGKHAVASVSLSDASAAQDTANNSSKTYIQSTTPVGRSQDLWIDTTGGNNTPKRWNGSAWVAVTDKAATDAAAAATASSMTYIQSSAPTGRSQDLWIDTTAGANTPKRWNGSAWVAVTDQAAITAAQNYTDTKFSASLKNTVVEYSVNSSETVAPTTGWSTATPTRTPGTFIWYRTVLTFGDNSTSTSNPALLTGNTGATGSAGTPAADVALTANTQVLASPAGGGTTSPATATVTGTALNTTISAWTYSVDGGAFSATVPTGVSRSANVVTITGSTMTARTITVSMADSNGVSDTLTVAKTFDGAAGTNGTNGSNGAAGVDAYTVLLTNEAQVFAGSTTTANAGSATTSVVAYKGATQQTANIGTITGQVTGLTTAITNNNTNSPTVTITVTTALTTQSGTLTIPVTVPSGGGAGSITINKSFAWSVSYTGATGSTGATGVSVSSITPYFYQVSPSTGAAPATPTASPPPAPWTTTEPTYTANTALYRTERILYSNATFAYTGVYRSSSYDAAATAQATADGKNKIVRSTSDATGSAGFVDGDLWWKVDVSNNVIKQWKFVLGTGWVVELLNDGVLGNLNANKIVAGSTFTQDLNVKSNFTLGDATTPGAIRSYDYVLNTTGFSLSSAGLQINNGDIDAKTLRANSSFVTNLFIGTGGAIQSTGYSAGVTGFRLSNAGLVIEGAGNTVSASAIKAGTVTATTINIGATGVLNVDSTGVIKSNNYAANTTGYQLSNTGLEINDGSIDAKVMKTGTAFITDLIMGRSADALGTIRSFDYSSGTAGWKIGKGLFEVNGGTIKAAALQLQDSDNVMPVPYADFEFTSTFYSQTMFSPANVTKTIGSSGARFSSQFLSARATTAAAFDLYLGSTVIDYNVPVEASTTYILSAWVKTGTVASTVTLKAKLSNATVLTAATQALGASGAWQRVSGTVAVPAGVTNLEVVIGSTTATIGAGFDIDGVQIERQMAGITTPSPWTAPGMTFADGGIIRTGEIRSTTNVTVNGVQQPAWSINMSGGAQFGNANIRGALVVGPAGADTDAGQSFISSGNFVANTTGWKIDSTGDLEANSGRIRGNAVVDGTLSGTKIIAKTLTSDLIALGILKTNLINDASFEETYTIGTWVSTSNAGNTEQWRKETLTGSATIGRVAATGRSGNYSIQLTAGPSSNAGILSNAFQVTPGMTYKLTYYACSVAALSTGTLAIWSGSTAAGVSSSNLVTPVVADDGTGWPQPPLAAATPAVSPTDFFKYECEFTPTLSWVAIRLYNLGGLATNTFVVDDVSVVQMGIGGGTELTAAGLRLFDDDGRESGAFVSNRPNYFSVSSGGAIVATVDGTGAISGTSITSTSDFYGLGGPLLGRADSYFQKMLFTDDVNRTYETSPRGYLEGVSGNNLGFVSFPTGTFSSTALTSTGTGQAYQLLFQMNADVEPYRVYEFDLAPVLATIQTGILAIVNVRFTTNGTDPTVASPVFARGLAVGAGNAESINVARKFYSAAATTADYRFLVELRNGSTSGTVTLSANDVITATVNDLGHVLTSDYQIINQVVQGGAAPPTQPTTKKTYTQTWTANGNQTRRGTSSLGNNTVNTSAPSGYTLAGYYSSTNGNQYTYLQFTGTGSLGQTITTALTSATVSKVELYVRDATFFNTGGGSQRFSMTSLTALPSAGAASATGGNNYTGNLGFTQGQGKWITLPSSSPSAASTVLGGGRVAIIGPGSSSSNYYYSKWYYSTSTPQLRITYTK